MEKNIIAAYELAKETYASIGVDTEKAIGQLSESVISMHAWQGDDCHGFENINGEMTGGILSTGNYPGCAKSPKELRQDLLKALSLIPGEQKVNLHAFHIEPDGKTPDRNKLTPADFASWAEWAAENKLGLDFNGTFFSHEKSASGFTLSSADKGIRDFWIEHAIASRKIGEYFGKVTGKTCITNLWIPDGFKDKTVDSTAPRLRLKDSLDIIFKDKIDKKLNKDAVESKLFGIGSESYVTGSHEFYMGYTMQNKDIVLTLDAGHFHPTESIGAKMSSLLLFIPELLLHVSRGVRWDSDHVVTFDDELVTIMQEIVRNDAMNKVNIGLDYFDGSINRIAAWVIGMRNSQKALLRALLEPTAKLRELENHGDYTARLALTEEYKSYPFNAVYDYFCLKNNVPVRDAWLSDVKKYEAEVLNKRG